MHVRFCLTVEELLYDAGADLIFAGEQPELHSHPWILMFEAGYSAVRERMRMCMPACSSAAAGHHLLSYGRDAVKSWTRIGLCRCV